jgi:hypothetical protein
LFTNSIHSYLAKFYTTLKNNAQIHSFYNQINIVNKRFEVGDCTLDTINSVEIINNLYINTNNNGLFDSINLTIDFFMLNRQYNMMIVHLKQLLNYAHYNTLI